MNTLNYIGSKKTLCPIILDIITREIGDTLHTKSFIDMFAGTGSIGFRFQDIVNGCISNDLEYYSFVINNALLKCNYSLKLKQVIDDCQILEGVEGLIYQNYSTNAECERMFFSNENARKCDSIRQHIEQLKIDNILITIWKSEKMEKHINRKFNQNGFFICKMDKNGLFTKICFGEPFNFEKFIEGIKQRQIIFDSGMYDGNNRNY